MLTLTRMDLGSRVSATTGATGWLMNVPALGRMRAQRSQPSAILTTPVPTVAEAHGALSSLGGALRDAFSALNRRLQGRATAAASPGAPAIARGQVSSLGTAWTLRATREVNEQTSTVRASSQALGLDTTSAAAPSRLSSTGAIGLDVTSAEQASVLQSSATLGLDVASAETASTITSTAEANTMATSYGVVQATFRKGAATQGSLGNLSGTYAGTGAAANATSLTLEITSLNGTIGSVPTLVSVKATDQTGTNLGTYSGFLTTGQTLSLGADIGLSIAFTAGSILNQATTTFAVSRTTPTTVDATGAFNDADVNLRPRFDDNRPVTAGSFTVNGTSVSVAANDSIDSVLARIDSTVSGVTASFSGDKVTIQSVNPSEDDIVLGGDTSGFLTALNLTTATTVKGNVRDDRQVLSKTAQFGTLTAGAFTLNGVSISVDPVADSLQTLITRINSSNAGVSASYDTVSDRLRLTSSASSEDDVVVGGDTSGFLTAAKLATGNTVRGNIHDDVQALTGVSRFSGVTAGSFTINGVAVALDPAADTLQALVTRINAAGAGVTATYDSATDTLKLETTSSSEDDIVAANDTTGFLSAVKLAAATTVQGNIADDQQVLTKTARFAGVANGSFSVNGRVIAVTAGTDTLQSVVARINDAGAGVSASYDAAQSKVVFTPATAGATLVVDQDTSGFLAAAAVSQGATGTRVNPDGAFNQTNASSPLLDPGQNVTAGSFKVNGVTIAVAASDTLSAVLARITAAAAGVTATFDAPTETVRLTAKAAGSAPIAVGDDTSGFLAAVKLDGTATSTAGTSTLDSPLASHAAFAGVTGGALTINGVSITIDPGADTLSGIVTAINAVSGVAATLDANSGRVTLQSERTGGELQISDGTGLLAALGVTNGRVQGKAPAIPSRTWRQALDESAVAATGVADVVGSVNAALDTLDRAANGSPRIRDAVLNALGNAVATLPGGSASGLSLSQTGSAARLLVDANALTRALASDPTTLDDFLSATHGLPAVVDAARDAYDRAVAQPATVTTEPTRGVPDVRQTEATKLVASLGMQSRRLQAVHMLQLLSGSIADDARATTRSADRPQSSLGLDLLA